MKLITRIKNMTKKKKIAAIIGAVLVVSIAGAGVYKSLAKPSADETYLTDTVFVEKQDLSQTLTISGQVESLSKEAVTSQVADAKVLKLNVKVGDRVKAGDVIAVLDDTSVKQQLENADRSLNNSEIKSQMSIASAQRSYNALSDDTKVADERAQASINEAAGDLDTATAEYNEALSDYEWAKAHYAQAKSEYDAEVAKDGIADLINKRTALRKPYQEAGEKDADFAARYQAYTAEKDRLDYQLFDVDARKAILDNAEKLRDEKKATFTTKEAALKSAQSAYTKANESKYDLDTSNGNSLLDRADSIKSAKLDAEDAAITGQQDVDKIENLLEQCTVTAPIDGIVTSVGVKTGEIYKGTEIAVIQDDSGFTIAANVDQYDIGKILSGMPTVIRTDATGDKEMSGEIIFVSPTPVGSDSQTASSAAASTSVEYRVESTLKDPDPLLRIGMTAKIMITLNEAKDALVVPDNCIQSDEDGESYVEVKDGEDSRIVYVTEGIKNDYYTQIISDEIEEGMEIVVPAIDDMGDMDGYGMFY